MMHDKQPQKKVAQRSQVISLEKGKLPPQAIELEQAVLGTALTYQNAIGQVVELFREEEVFYKNQHQKIYMAMLELFSESEPVDLITTIEKLREKNDLEKVGGEYYLIQLTNKISSQAHLEYHCRILLQYFVKRETIKVSNELLDKAYDDETDIFDLLAKSQFEIDNVAQWLIRKKPTDFKTAVDQLFDFENSSAEGIPSSLRKLQKHTNGYRKSDLIILAARPGMGKTALLLNEVLHQALQQIPVGIFSLEMSEKDLSGRIFANHIGVSSNKITHNQTNDFEKRLMQEHRAEFEKLPIHIHDQAAMTPMELKIQASKWKREKGVQMIYIDYLQLMSAHGKNSNGNREQEISSISRSLKAMAKELDLPVMALSQLSRAPETRGGMKRPILSDLRESGAIEQDADIIFFLLRPEYYKISEWDDESRSSTAGQAEIGIAKFRGGKTGSLVVGTELEYMRFYDLDDHFDYPAPPPVHTPAAEEYDDHLNDQDDDLPF